MRFLLDTHVMLWVAHDERGHLPKPMRDAVDDENSELIVSVVSIWEMAIKHRLGRLLLPCPLDESPALLAAARLNILELDVDSVLADVDPLPDTRDPFDRLLLAICQREQLRLLTVDDKLRDHPLAWRPA